MTTAGGRRQAAGRSVPAPASAPAGPSRLPRRLRALFLLPAVCCLLSCGGGRTLPDAEAIHLDGSPFRTAALRGQAAWFEFWAPWDPASRQRVRDLGEILQRHPDWSGRLRLVLVAVNSQPAEVREALPKGVVESFEVVVETGEFAQAMGVAGLPATLLVGADGRYQHVREGYVEAPVLEGAVEALISGTSGTPSR